MNSVNMIGRLTKDPELRRTDSNIAVCSFSLAVKRPGAADKVDFVDCVVWRQGAEFLGRYGSKGAWCGISGSLQSREWTNKDRKTVTAWEVVADKVELMSAKKESSGGQGAQGPYGNMPAWNHPGYPGSGCSQPQYTQQQFGMIPDDAELPF